MSVPGPKLRFSLFSYAEENEKEEEKDEAFEQFMQDIANMYNAC